ncbi:MULTISPECIES: Ig-like domain-containing protein [unclassified Imperialibacter]|uniref:Ig-like domain-containing protein n=1 Tax=unclassified Imperialibacter TaxID=2629706 RepID=UPI001259C214|nr:MULTISPECIES: Ig-like domain-containing protein [unclassified Imperialibacter]CAD5252338.1 exported hypothetical protein [Imperialibacter sp. 75]CAD5298378.1 exported hypothetical protein [Imperialibacter sp. 89]VVT13742.1 exported hypothetical protein [Imperialibacter sp. EC-SDR9]
MKKLLFSLLFILSALISWAQYEPLTWVTGSPASGYNEVYLDMTFGYTMQFVETDVAARDLLITIANESGSFTYSYGSATLTPLSGGKTRIKISSSIHNFPPGSAHGPYDWPHGIRLKVTISAGMFKNQNNVVWPASESYYYVTAVDNIRPIVRDHNATGLINDEDINYYYFEFSEPVIRGNGMIRFINEEDPSRSLVYSSFDPRVSIVPILNTPGSGLSKSTVAIRPDKLISDGGFLSDDYDRYRVQIDRDAFVDTRGAGLDVHYLSEQFTVNNNIAYDFEFAVGLPYENHPPQREVGTFSVKGVGYPQFSITNNPAYPDNNLFYVVGDKLKTKISFDYETKSSYTLEVAVAELVMEITVDVIDAVTEAPQLVATAPVSSALPPQFPGNLVRRLKMEFHQPITVTDNSIYIYKKPSNTLVQQINLSTDPNVSIYNENTLIVNIDALESSTSYYVYVPNNAIALYPGRIADTDWQFTTANVLSAPTGPTNITLSQNSVYENEPLYTNIGALTATDPTLQETFDYYFTDTGTKISPDGKFTITQFQQDFGLNTGILFDYEDQNSYNVDITVQDAGGLRYSKIFTINILDGDNEAPTNIQFSGQFATDGQPVPTIMGQFTTTDALTDTHVYQLVGGEGDDDNAKFTISGNNLRSAMVFDYTTQNTFKIRVRSRDQGFLTVVRTFTVQIAPSDPNFNAITKLPQTITFPTMNNVTYSPAQTIPLAATASSGLSLIYSINAGQAYVDGSTLHITGGGLIEIEAYQSGNATFSSASETASFTVNKAAQTITFGALAPKVVGDAPYNVTATSTSGLTPIFQSSNTAVATINASGLVTIVAAGTTTITASHLGDLEYRSTAGVGRVLTVNSPDIEPSIQYQAPENGAIDIEIDLSNNDLAFDFDEDVSTGSGAVLLIKNYDTDEIIESIDIANQSYVGGSIEVPISFLPYGTKVYILVEPVGTITSDDTGLSFSGLDDKNDWVFTTGAAPVEPAISSLSPANGATNVSVNSSFTLDFNIDLYVSPDVSLELRNYETDAVIEAMAITSKAYVDENIVLTPSSGLPEGTKLYAVLAGSGYIENYDCGCIEFEGLSNKDEWTFTTASADDTTPPQIVSLSPADDATNVPVNANFVATFDEPIAIGTGLAQAIILYKNNSEFLDIAEGDPQLTVSGNTLTVNFNNDLLPNTNYSIYIRNSVSDLSGNYNGSFLPLTSWNFTTAPAANSAPTDITLNTLTINESNGVDANVAAISTTDPDEGNTFSYSLVSGEGSTDNGSFRVTGNLLKVVIVTDFETKSSYSIRLRTTDNGGLTFEKSFTITVNNLPETPTDFTLSNTTIAENNAINATIGTFSTSDPDNGETFTYTLIGGAGGDDNGSFNINGASLRANSAFDFETKNSYSIRVRTLDSGGKSLQKTFIITVADVNDIPPALVSLTPTDNAVFDPETRVLSMTFDKPVRYGNVVGQFKIYTENGADFVNTNVEASESRVVINDNVVTVTFPGPDWLPGSYYVTLSANTIEDFDDNQFGGFSNPGYWNFTVTDPAKTNQIITLANIADKLTTDAAFEVSASASSGLAVALGISGPASLNGTTITLDGTAGTVMVTANQAGNDMFNAAPETSVSFEVTAPAAEKADQTITFDALPSKTFGAARFDLVASSDAALPVTFTSSNESVATISDATVTIVGAGTATITASQAGDTNHNAAVDVQQDLVVDKAVQTITFEPIAAQVLSTGAIPLAASASSGLTVSYEVSGPATLEGTTLTFTGAGDITVTASQAGNVNYMAATALPRTFTVTDDTPVDPVKEDQAISFEAIADKTFGDAAFDLTATSSSALPVSYTITGPATISGSTVTIIGAGSVTITASQSGNESFNVAPDLSQSFTVNKAIATITLSNLEQEADGSPKTPLATTDPAGLGVVFSFNGETIMPVAAGSYTVLATINDANYQGSAEAVFELAEVVETGVADELSLVLVYPNPFVETINIEGKNLSVIRLRNLNGQLMFERAVTDKTELATPDLMPGVYLLYLVDGEGRSNVRRMVKK